jgi:hypothetical protein
LFLDCIVFLVFPFRLFFPEALLTQEDQKLQKRLLTAESRVRKIVQNNMEKNQKKKANAILVESLVDERLEVEVMRIFLDYQKAKESTRRCAPLREEAVIILPAPIISLPYYSNDNGDVATESECANGEKIDDVVPVASNSCNNTTCTIISQSTSNRNNNTNDNAQNIYGDSANLSLESTAMNYGAEPSVELLSVPVHESEPEPPLSIVSESSDDEMEIGEGSCWLDDYYDDSLRPNADCNSNNNNSNITNNTDDATDTCTALSIQFLAQETDLVSYYTGDLASLSQPSVRTNSFALRGAEGHSKNVMACKKNRHEAGVAARARQRQAAEKRMVKQGFAFTGKVRIAQHVGDDENGAM